MKKICVCLLLVAVAAGGVVCFRSCSGEGLAHRKHLTEAEEMERLIERLANAYRRPVTIGGEAVVYRPKEDKAIRDEVLAKGKDAVPYLAKGLSYRKEPIRNECISLLGKIACKESIGALIAYLMTMQPPAKITDVYPELVQMSLHRLTGLNSSNPPIKDRDYDIEAMRQIWLPWWAANKDKLVDTDTGIGLKNDDGTITPLPLAKP